MHHSGGCVVIMILIEREWRATEYIIELKFFALIVNRVL